MQFDFGTDEEKAQDACHKLDVWRQTARLDKKLLYKLDREEDSETEASAAPENGEKPPKSEKAKPKGKKKASDESSEKPPAANGKVSLYVRLYFSTHEKLSEQRWLDRIPAEEPFQSASLKIIRKDDAEFDEAVERFSDQDRGSKPSR
jgi:hypothetical protein